MTLDHSINTRHERARAQLEQIKRFSGPAFMGGMMAAFSRGKEKVLPQFIRRGYESNIVEELRDFFTFKPWRPKNLRPAARTHKEQTNLLRRMRQAGLIVRLGRGRYGLAKVQPHA